MPLAIIAAGIALQTTADPLLLPIGLPSRVRVFPGQLVSTADGRSATPAKVARAARGTRFVYLGESHDNLLHHQMQADIIRALAADGRDVVVGMEMFTRPVQKSLAPWTLGWWTEEQFIEGSSWKTQWGFDYSLYKPIFDVAKELKLPIVALNVPREWVRAVGREGYGALTAEQKAALPPQMDLTNGRHRMVFNALMGGHPPTGARGENIYAAQVLWDEAMADTAIKYLQTRTSRRLVMAIVAGSGHVMYGQGINWRVSKRTGDRGITVVMGSSSVPREVSRGIGDFFYLAEDQAKPAG